MKYLTIAIGILALLVVTVVSLYATDFTAYLGSDPNARNNCHVMDAAYEGWFHGDHQSVATCSDCHTPHAILPKYFVKAQSGYYHVTTFLSGEIPDAIRAKPASKRIIQENCIRCHENTIATISAGPLDFDQYCFDCHRSIAHGERGVSIYPYQEEPAK